MKWLKLLPSKLWARIHQCISKRNLPENQEQLLQELQRYKTINDDTLQRLENVLNFQNMAVRDAMISRAQMNVIKSTDNIERIIAYITETAHSRFPVIADDKDHVLGILHAKDLLKYMLNPEQLRLEQILRPAVFIPEGQQLNTLLKTFQEQHNHMAVVVDEYGGISGLVTFEDLIEEIVGKIEDEFDDSPIDNIMPISAERWQIKATTEIEDINHFFKTHLSTEEADTIGGLVIHQLGHLPVRGEKVILDNLQFSVSRADKRRLHTLIAIRIKEHI